MLKRRVITLLVALTSLVGGHGALRPAVSFAALDLAAVEVQFLELVNADRAAHGLAPLVADARLMEVARWRSEDMVTRNFFSHDLGGFTVGRLLRGHQVSFNLAGENIVSNTFDDLSTVVRAQAELMKSATHRENILHADYTHAGVGIARGPNNRTIYTQIFIQAP